MIHGLLIHGCVIKRPTHQVTARKKSTGEEVVQTFVECRIESATDTPTLTLLGRTASETYRGWFPNGTDLRVGDRVLWLDKIPHPVFLAESLVDSPGIGAPIEASLRLVPVTES